MTATAIRSDLALRVTGRLEALAPADRAALIRRSASLDNVAASTAAIVADVRSRGDAALRELARRFDGVELQSIEVPRREMRRALDELAQPVRSAMERAARNISAVHTAFLPRQQEIEVEAGIIVGRRPDPIERVGAYAPGGSAAYPSSVLMTTIPARVAGVAEVVLTSPPAKNGLPSPLVLAAAALSGVDRIFSIGGAGAIAALAYGTESVPRVDRIVGPGNAYVAAAKLQLVGEVGIDLPAGPSELLVIADADSDPESIAAELVAQAEHDPLACVVAIVIGDAAARALEAALARAVTRTPRMGVVAAALAGQGAILVADSVDAAIAFANEYAPEHILLACAGAAAALPRVRNAGTVLVGDWASVAFGDYMTGANHVLPTGGSARSRSGLSSSDFIRWTGYQTIDKAASRALADDVAALAIAEGLPGHAAAAMRAGDRT